MKIAILTPTFAPFSGIDRVVELEAEELHKKNNKVTIFTFKAAIKPKHASLVEIWMPKNPTLERIYRLFFFLNPFALIRYTRKLKSYDMMICHFYPMTWLSYFAKKFYKVEYLYHDAGIAFPHLFRNLTERVYLRMMKFFLKFTLRNADKAISISAFLSKELEKDTGIKSKVEHCVIDKKRFHKGIDKKKILEIRKRYDLKPKQPLFIYVGRISPHKGIDLLIKAFNIIQKSLPDSKLMIVGKHTFGAYSKELKELADENVIFTGFVDDKDLAYYYAAADVYATATLWEGFDLPIVEAAAVGTPTVAFDLCSHPEVTKLGILVPPYDLNEFAKAAVKLVKMKKNR